VNIYVETNFVLELVFQQEQYQSCQDILELSQAGKVNLVTPAYSLIEPQEKLTRQAQQRKKLNQELSQELAQLIRTDSYRSYAEQIESLKSLVIQSIDAEQERFIQYREQLLKTAEIIPLTSEILEQGASYEEIYHLGGQDAIVLASVLSHLQDNNSDSACFLNRNSRDFNQPDIKEFLDFYQCKLITTFPNGLDFVKSQLAKNNLKE